MGADARSLRVHIEQGGRAGRKGKREGDGGQEEEGRRWGQEEEEKVLHFVFKAISSEDSQFKVSSH